MTGETGNISSDLIRWLKLLDLPNWAKIFLAAIMLLALSSSLALLINGVAHKDKDAVSSAVSILTVALPIGLVIVALVFGDGGTNKLRELTHRVLNEEVPQAIRENLLHGQFTDNELNFHPSGFISDYSLIAIKNNRKVSLKFRIELNIKKVNVVFLIPHEDSKAGDAKSLMKISKIMQSCLEGAEREGYILNPIATPPDKAGLSGLVFIKTMHSDFLLEPAQRLYFAQDFAFFVRGMLEANFELS